VVELNYTFTRIDINVMSMPILPVSLAFSSAFDILTLAIAQSSDLLSHLYQRPDVMFNCNLDVSVVFTC